MTEADLNDPVELNRLLAADHRLRDNMLSEGFIKAVPFMRDHNEAFETQYILTDHGRVEMQARIQAMTGFAIMENVKRSLRGDPLQ